MQDEQALSGDLNPYCANLNLMHSSPARGQAPPYQVGLQKL